MKLPMSAHAIGLSLSYHLKGTHIESPITKPPPRKLVDTGRINEIADGTVTRNTILFPLGYLVIRSSRCSAR